jgi:hypothetical protein
MRPWGWKGLLLLSGAALSVPAALTLPHLPSAGELASAPDPSLADEPVGNLPGVRYHAVRDVAPPPPQLAENLLRKRKFSNGRALAGRECNSLVPRDAFADVPRTQRHA